MKKLLFGIVKIGIPCAIFAWLGVQAHRSAAFADLRSQSKHWELLAAGTIVMFAAVLVTMLRWYYLVRVIGLPITLREAFRVGFLGFLVNFAPFGIVGGDLLKAVMLAHRRPGMRAEAFATVVMDRAIGLWVLFLVASAALVLTGCSRSEDLEIRWACNVTFVLTLVTTAGMALPLLPDVSGGRVAAWTHKVPWVGPPVARLAGAVRLYRFHLPALAVSSLMTVPVHVLIAVSVWYTASGLYDRVHTLPTHLVVVPMSSATSVVPLSAGPFEVALNELYVHIGELPGGGRMVAGQGFVVALGYRLITALIAAVGFGYYLASRREVTALMHEVEGLPATS